MTPCAMSTCAARSEHHKAQTAKIQHQIDLVREYHTRPVTDVVTGKLDVRDVALPEPALDEEADLLDDLDEELSGGEGSDDQEVFDDDV
jgi:type I restriction enzyme, S subunit